MIGRRLNPVQEDYMSSNTDEPSDYLTVEQIAAETGVTAAKAREALTAINAQVTIFAFDKRRRYYHKRYVDEVRAWLRTH
jgi:hypothetical protein